MRRKSVRETETAGRGGLARDLKGKREEPGFKKKGGWLTKRRRREGEEMIRGAV